MKKSNAKTDVPTEGHMIEFLKVFYLTIIAIIEGVAFILLIDHTLEPLKEVSVDWVEWLHALPYSMTSLVLLILITYQYAFLILLCNWNFTIWDTIFPFTLGVCQASQTFFFDDAFVWWAFLLATSIVSLLSLYTTKNLLNKNSDNDEFLKKINRSMSGFISKIWFSLAGIVLILVVIHYHLLPEYLWLFLLIPVTSAAFIMKTLRGDFHLLFNK